MAENKKSYVGYVDWGDTFDMLDDESAGKLIKHFYAYIRDQNPKMKDKLLEMAFHPIKLQLKRDLVKYEEKRKLWSEAGKRSAAKAALQKSIDAESDALRSTESTDVENVKGDSTESTVTDNVTVNVNDTVIKEAIASVENVPNYLNVEKDKQGIAEYIRDHKPTSPEPYKDLWNLFAEQTGLSKIKELSETRKKKFKVRINEKGFDFLTVIKKANLSEFIKTSKWFTFDWILENDSNYLKVIEGNYDNKTDSAKIIQISSGPSPAELQAQRIYNEVNQK